MQGRFWGVGLFVFLLPFVCFSQCTEQEWHSIISAVPNGLVGATSQNPLVVSFEEVSDFYTVSEYNSSSTLILDAASFTPSNCGGSSRGFVVQKFSVNGVLQWYLGSCFSFIGTVDGATMDDEGSLYVCGNFSGDLVFDGVLLGSVPVASYFVLKIAANGQLEWHEIGERSAAVGASWTPEGLVLFLSVSDSVSFNGSTFYNESGSPTPDRDNIVLLADSDGNVIWHQIMTGIDNPPIYATSYNDNIFVVQGRFDAELIYDGQTMTTNGFTLYQLAFNLSDGSREWMKKSNVSAGVYSNVSVVFEDSLFVSVGLYHENLSVDGNSISENGFGSDGFIMMQRVDDGSVLWLNSFGAEREDAVYDVCVSPSGLDIIVCGMYASTTVNYQGITLTNNAAEVEDPFVLELDRDGKPSCALMDLGTPSSDAAVSVSVIGEHIFPVFSFRDSTSFSNVAIQATGLSDLAILKTCMSCDTSVGISEQRNEAQIELYPNPTTAEFRLKLPTGVTALSVVVYNMQGKRVMEQTYQATIDVSSLQIGSYIVAIYTADQTYRQLLVLE